MNKRIEREKQTIQAMLQIYCIDKHGQSLCSHCQQLLNYAFQRLDVCPFQQNKPACNHCQVHCYAKNHQAQIQQVMRYAGPRMFYRHPWLSLRHLLDTFRTAPSLLDR